MKKETKLFSTLAGLSIGALAGVVLMSTPASAITLDHHTPLSDNHGCDSDGSCGSDKECDGEKECSGDKGCGGESDSGEKEE